MVVLNDQFLSKNLSCCSQGVFCSRINIKWECFHERNDMSTQTAYVNNKSKIIGFLHQSVGFTSCINQTGEISLNNLLQLFWNIRFSAQYVHISKTNENFIIIYKIVTELLNSRSSGTSAQLTTKKEQIAYSTLILLHC